MIWSIGEVQLFLLLHPKDNMSLSGMELINYAMIKINKTGIYYKALERWNAKVETDRIVWEKFHNHMIEEYKKLLAKGGGETLSREGYGTEFHTAEEIDNNN